MVRYRFGVNDGSEFFVQQNVRTSFAVNVSNQAEYSDAVKLKFDTQSIWDYGFDEDLNDEANWTLI